MNALRQAIAVVALAAGLLSAFAPAFAQSGAQSGPATPEAVLRNWYRLTLELVRHTPTYSPPVASRAFA